MPEFLSFLHPIGRHGILQLGWTDGPQDSPETANTMALLLPCLLQGVSCALPLIRWLACRAEMLSFFR